MAKRSGPSDDVLRSLEKVPNSYLILSPALYILTASDRYLEATETQREIITGKHIFEAFPDNPDWPDADGVKNINESLQIVLDTKKPHQMQLQKYDVPDNKQPGKFLVRYWEPSHTPVLDHKGSISYIIQSANDVTARVLTEKRLADSHFKEGAARVQTLDLLKIQGQLQSTVDKLAESEVKTSNIIRNAPFPIAVYIGREMRVEFANQAMLDVWGKGNNVIGKLYADVLPELDNQKVFDQLDDVFTTGMPFNARNQLLNLVVNGVSRSFYYNYSLTPLKDSTGSIYGVMNTGADVSDVVRAKLDLEKSEKELQAANEELAGANEELAATNEELQSANEELILSREELLEINTRYDIALEAGSFGSTEVDLATGSMICNEQFKACFGRKKDDVFTYPDMFAAMLPEYREKVRELAIASRENHTLYKAEYEVEWPDGTRHWIKAYGRARYDVEGNAIKMIGLLSEITESKQDEQRKNDFIGMVSHEMKTPLTSLKGYIQLLQLKTRHFNDDFVTTTFDKANRQISKMTTMINGFLNLSRFESGKIFIDRQQFDMQDLLKEVEEEIVPMTSSHRIIFEPVPPTIIDADRDKIGQVINNFISNALKYSVPGSVVTVGCAMNKGDVQVSVKDEGMGVAAKDIDRLFDRYYRVDGHQMQTVSGFGIGLYLCAEIIKRHDGKIWVESEPGNGSTFYFSIPL